MIVCYAKNLCLSIQENCTVKLWFFPLLDYQNPDNIIYLLRLRDVAVSFFLSCLINNKVSQVLVSKIFIYIMKIHIIV